MHSERVAGKENIMRGSFAYVRTCHMIKDKLFNPEKRSHNVWFVCTDRKPCVHDQS